MEEIKKLKNLRKTKLASFTRKKNSLQKLLEEDPSVDRLKEVLEDVRATFHALEVAHDNFAAVVEEQVLDDEGDFLETPSSALESVRSEVAVKIMQLDKAEKFEEARKQLEHHVNAFGSPSRMFTELSTAKDISFSDMRLELTKLEETFAKVQTCVLYIDSEADNTELMEKYQTQVVDEFERCKVIGLKYMKDVPSSTSEDSVVAGVSGVRSLSVSGSGSLSTTKRETVMLPHFSGDEKTAYLKYPIWKEQWTNHIQEYEEKYRATMLLNHLDEKAQLQIVGLENDYEEAMKQLDSYYVDAKKVVRACLDEIRAYSQVAAYDYKGLVGYKKCLLNNHARLKAAGLEHEMSNTAAMGVLIRKFPIMEAVEWQKFLSRQDKAAQNKPFPSFIKWLNEAGASWELLAASGTGIKGKSGNVQVHHTFYGEEDGETSKGERKCYKCGKEGHLKKDCTAKDTRVNGGGTRNSNQNNRKPRPPPKHRKHHCAYHKDTPNRYCSTWSCPSLKYLQYAERIKLLRENLDCETCCGDCPKGNCLSKTKRVCGGSKDGRGCGVNHVGHELWCPKAKLCFTVSNETVLRSVNEEEDGVLLQVMKIPSIDDSAPFETVLWDTACTGLFVRSAHAISKGFPSKEKLLRVVTLGGDVKEINGVIYECQIMDLKGNTYSFSAHGLDEVTGALNTVLGDDLLRKLFPSVIGANKLCGAPTVDYLIGLSKASWQPERILKSEGGGDFWMWQNDFGTCIGGSHPWVGSYVTRSDSLYTVLKVIETSSVYIDSLKIPTCSSYYGKSSPADSEDFFRTEQLGTVIEPKCGSCRCGKCPVPGSRYSFKEENELKMIQEGLRYDSDNGTWVAKYPFLFPSEHLKGSKSVAMRSMISTEKTLLKNENWGNVYREQIQDMLDRNVARIVSEEELASYTGHINYLPHLAVTNPKSSYTPVRICFDASRAQGGGPSLNALLAKGPDCFLNNLAAVITRFRSGPVAAKGDVSKMYNSVSLEKEDAFLQCFLWRNLDLETEPVTYQVVVNNIGVKPAGCIATLALYGSADIYKEKYTETSRQLMGNSYVDDVGLTGKDMAEIKRRTKEADEILGHANMRIKKWIYSGENTQHVDIGEISGSLPLEDSGIERMLGVMWDPKSDSFRFAVRINLSTLKKKSRIGPDISREELLEKPPKFITRRQYYSQVQSLFDPLGLLSPILLQAKMLLRKTWEDGCEKLGWDESLPPNLVDDMVKFFIDLFNLENVDFARSLIPKDQEVIGNPDLVIFSDGSVNAFGSVSYIRWELKQGGWWTNIVLSKSKIAPKSRLTIPRLELNGAVLSKRLEEFVTGTLDLQFENVYHLVDSSTVLGYLHKPDSKLKPFEGIRVSEVQAAGKFTEGRLHNWSWLEGIDNPADWATKPRKAEELIQGGFWQKGPRFLEKHVSEWPIKLDFRTDRLDGELKPKGVMMVFMVSDEMCDVLTKLLQKFSSPQKLFNVVAYVFKWKSMMEVKPCQTNVLSNADINKSRNTWIKLAQRDMEQDLLRSTKSQNDEAKIHGPFRRLSPFKDSLNIWRVGLRLQEFTPFTEDHKPPAILPQKHRLTWLLMKEAHDKKHGGINETVTQFRLSGYWSPRAKNVAKAIRKNCVPCRYLDHRPLKQEMGKLKKDQFVTPSAWSRIELDLFGPFTCRSEVNKRSSKKVWGMVIVDEASGAIHSDIVLDYSTQEVLKTLRRFASLRGWPIMIRSDPGSQLESAAGILGSWWNELSTDLTAPENTRQFTWNVSPADSPWRQGRSEVSVKIIKRLLRTAVGDIRLTPSELQTALFEAADLCNQRPIGLNKVPEADGTFKVLTPNCLLMGRATSAAPDDSDLSHHMKKTDRYILIQQVTRAFWSRWMAEVTPLKIIRQKWHATGRNLAVGDLVLVLDENPIKGKYKLALVDSVKVSSDGLVRSCVVKYRLPATMDTASVLHGKMIKVTRSIQRLSLILPVEEQNGELTVEDGIVKAKLDNEVKSEP